MATPNLRPNNNSEGNLGTSSKKWAEVNAVIINENGSRVATLASPDLTGTPTAPKPADADNTTKIATTSWVRTLITGIWLKLTGSPTTNNLLKYDGSGVMSDSGQSTTTLLARANHTGAQAQSTITDLVTDQATQTTAIATNATAIAGINTTLGTVGSDTDVTTNATNIATNVTNIATNVTNIATNTSGIAANLSSINALEVAAATINYSPDIVNLIGGAASQELVGIVTTSMAVGRLQMVVLSNGSTHFYKLTTTSTITPSPQYVPPADYNAVTNQKVWVLTSVTVDGFETDTIAEATADAGVTIDGVVCLDNDLSATDLTASGATSTATLVVTSTSEFDAQASFGTSLKVDTIYEKNSGFGVTVDEVKFLNGGIICKDGADLDVDTINEASSTLGVTIDGVLCKDNDLSATDVTASGAIAGATVAASGAVTGAAVTATGAIAGASVAASGAVTGATVTATGDLSGAAKVIFSGVQTVGAGGTTTALDLTKSVHHIDADGGGDIFTLADGVVGQIKTICMDTATGVATITPTNLAGGTSVTFNAAGETVILQFVDTQWYIIGGNAYTVV